MKTVWLMPPREDWIVDRFVQEWTEDNADITVSYPDKADVIWLLADWCWRSLPEPFLRQKKVLTSVHHIVPEKFGWLERQEWNARDQVTTAYHVYNQHTLDFIKPLTQKPIHLIKYWANQKIWRPTGTKTDLRKKHGLPADGYLVGSFQRDTEGAGIPQGVFKPKLEKGPDLLVDYLDALNSFKISSMPHVLQGFGTYHPLHVVLAGWRRQYVIEGLKRNNVPYTYFERPPQETINELYQCLDLYAVTARQEGGPQALIECGLLNVPVVSTPVGIAEQVLPPTAINERPFITIPAVPNVEDWKLPMGYQPYRDLIENL